MSAVHLDAIPRNVMFSSTPHGVIRVEKINFAITNNRLGRLFRFYINHTRRVNRYGSCKSSACALHRSRTYCNLQCYTVARSMPRGVKRAGVRLWSGTRRGATNLISRPLQFRRIERYPPGFVLGRRANARITFARKYRMPYASQLPSAWTGTETRTQTSGSQRPRRVRDRAVTSNRDTCECNVRLYRETDRSPETNTAGRTATCARTRVLRYGSCKRVFRIPRGRNRRGTFCNIVDALDSRGYCNG